MTPSVSVETLREIADLVVFDKDGTLVDLHAPWGEWAEQVAARLVDRVPPERLLNRLGWDARAGRIRPETPLAIASPETLIAALATWLYETGLGWSEAMARARRAVSEVERPPARAVCPLEPLFEHLVACGFRLAVVTSDDAIGVECDLGGLGVLEHVSAVVSGDSGHPPKPSPDMLLAVCESAGVPASRAVMVGDSLSDLRMGREAGVALVVGVLSGSGDAETLGPVADVLLRDVCELEPS